MSRAFTGSASDIQASTLVFAVHDLVAEHAREGRSVPVDLCAELVDGLREIAEHVMALEAVARAAGLLDRSEFRAAVTALPVDSRRALARAALAKANGRVVPFQRRTGR